MNVRPLHDARVVTTAVNVPGPVAAARLRELGARVTKVEPPPGDPLSHFCPAWYDKLCDGQEVVQLDLKSAAGRDALDGLLAASDLLLTATRPAALAALDLDWPRLHARFPHLSHVAMVGYPAPDTNRPGHDLTYLASLGLLTPPRLPPTLLADVAGAERAVSTALALLLARTHSGEGGYGEVSLASAAEPFAAPLQHGLTAPDGLLGGGLPSYNLYRARDGWVAVAALEPHFWERLQRELELDAAEYDDLARVFATRSAAEWETWAAERDLPLAALLAPRRHRLRRGDPTHLGRRSSSSRR